MHIFRIFGIILICVFAAIAGFSWYAGIFDPVDMSLEKQGPFQLIYREHRGPYQGIHFILSDVYRYVRDSLKVTTDSGFTVFFDTPGTTAGDSLRSLSGIVAGCKKDVRPPYKKGTVNEVDAIVGRYRLRSFFSYMTGSYKFYAELPKYAEKNGVKRSGPVLEMYDMSHRLIVYIAPCNRGASPVPAFGGN